MLLWVLWMMSSSLELLPPVAWLRCGATSLGVSFWVLVACSGNFLGVSGICVREMEGQQSRGQTGLGSSDPLDAGLMKFTVCTRTNPFICVHSHFWLGHCPLADQPCALFRHTLP